MRARATGRVVVLGLVGSLLAGCGQISLQGVPLPGGADLGGKPFTVIAQFRDVQDLVPQSNVKVNNVAVGQVKSIELNPQWNANAVLELNADVKLPANATAQLKQTTLLGEKYIELGPPIGAPPQGSLREGSVIPVERTNRFPEVEEIFGALSMLLNGGGLGQVQSIAGELNKALGGREGDTRALLADLNLLISTLDGQRVPITRALDGVDKLSARLTEQRENLDAVLTDLEPGLAVLNDQRPQLVGLLKSLDKLSGVATHVVKKSHDDLVHDLRKLQPTLQSLADSGKDLPNSLEVLATPPFTDSAIKPTAGCCMNLNAHVDLDIGLLIGLLMQPPMPNELPGLPTLPGPLNTLPTAQLPHSLGDVLPSPPHPPLLGHSPDSGRGLRLPGLGGN